LGLGFAAEFAEKEQPPLGIVTRAAASLSGSAGGDLYVHIDIDVYLDHQCRKMIENNFFHDFSVV